MLTPDESSELAELRRRAYGTAEGIGDEEAALRRLQELEQRVRQSDTTTVESALDAADLEPLPAPDDASLRATVPEPAAAPPEPRSGARAQRGWMSITLIAVAAAVMGAIIAGVVVTAAGSQTVATEPSPSPSPSASPTPLPPIAVGPGIAAAALEPNPALSGKSPINYAQWAGRYAMDIDTFRAYRQIGPITAWTADTLDGPGRCLMLQVNDTGVFRQVSYAYDGQAPSAGFVVTEEARASGLDLPVGSVLLFVDTGDVVEVRISTP